MNAFEAQVQAYMAEHDLLPLGAPVLVGLSGGLDSVVLTQFLHKMGHPVHVVHVNYQLRGADSEADETFVRELCKKQHLALTVAHFDTKALAAAQKESVQEVARNLRYQVLEETALKENISYVAMAHHADDQAETLLLNLLRGTGLEGLAGMMPKRAIRYGVNVQVIRPFLSHRRMKLIEYAAENRLRWRDDTSNFDPKYRRSLIRHRILPILRKEFGEAAIDHFIEAADLVQAYLVSDFYPKLNQLFETTSLQPQTALSIPLLIEQPKVWRDRLLLEALRRWLPEAAQSQETIERLADLLARQTGSRLEFGEALVWRDRNRLIFEEEAGKHEVWHGQIEANAVLETPLGRLSLGEIEPAGDLVERLSARLPNEELLDAAKLQFPLTVRHWQLGDVFCPLGMKGLQKKVSDFLTDAKVPTHQRHQALVLCSGDTLVCVLGHRLDDRFKVGADTQSVIRLRLGE